MSQRESWEKLRADRGKEKGGREEEKEGGNRRRWEGGSGAGVWLKAASVARCES